MKHLILVPFVGVFAMGVFGGVMLSKAVEVYQEQCVRAAGSK